MIRLIALAAFAFVLTTPSQAMPLAPVPTGRNYLTNRLRMRAV